MKKKPSALPAQDTISVLVATILLAYTLTHFVPNTAIVFDLTILLVYLLASIIFSTLVAVLVICLTATGTAWMLREHPTVDDSPSTFVHWLLPSLTSMVLMLTIGQLPFGGIWWVAAAVSGAVMMLVLTAEYCVLDPANPYYQAAEMGITALSFALFLILAIAAHASEIRLFYRIPFLSLAALLVFLRVHHLRHHGMWAFPHGAVVFLLIGELAAGFHYWPMESIPYGIALVGPLYSLMELSSRIQRAADQPVSIHTLSMPALLWVLAWFFAYLL